MLVLTDKNGRLRRTQADSSVKIILSEEGMERHINVTSEGIIIDLVKDGEVVETRSLEHHDLLEVP